MSQPELAPYPPLAYPPVPYAPPPPRRFDWRRIITLVGMPLFMGGCGAGVLVWVGYRIGITALVIGFVAAIIPVPVLVACFLWLDRYEPEPIRNLAICLAWGACVATAGAVVIEWGMAQALAHYHLSKDLIAVVGAPLAEESMKALGPVLLLVLSRHRAFSGVVDGIVYCGLSATGFAMMENILYLGGYGYAAGVERGGTTGGIAGLVGVFIGRILLSGFAHPLFTAMTGIGLGVAARSADRRVRWLAPLAGLLTAMILHGTWNLMSTLANNTQNPTILLYGYFAVMMPIFLGMVGFALWLRSWEGRLTQRILPQYVRAGWFAPPEVATLRTIGRRQAARNWAKRVAGEPGAAAMRGFQFAATQLALLRDGMHRGLVRRPQDLAHSLAEERRLLESIAGYRSVFAGRDPLAPRAIWDGTRYHVTFPDGTVRVFDAPPQPVVPTPVVFSL
ncbi:MAG TPA: PrsW family intramembrane metalloprotease [Rugosimonospora sp.]|nr:PrsW family intramembrane metalloprotease [Rugosimonospora sp.]